MKVYVKPKAGPTPPVIKGVIFDIDNTVYSNPGYFSASSCGEIAAIAQLKGQAPETVAAQLHTIRQKLGRTAGRPVTLTEAVYALGVTADEWHQLRCRVWQPEGSLTADDVVCVFFQRLAERFSVIAFGTNSPAVVGERVLKSVGLRSALPVAPIYGAETLAVSKPDPQFFARLAQRLHLPPEACLSVGDRDFSDGPPAISAGYAGAIIFPDGRDELLANGSCLLDDSWRREVAHV
ncbi:MAG: Protein containing Haloacid dehalogenase-like hydrolase domain [Parcubacteria group bacterium Gr01-1014_31]|nr:MAG: Protein containing Haloacid dehalogenase-like hydrolase domain [Parcubacteria group bacterium Gr01-1014_31]